MELSHVWQDQNATLLQTATLHQVQKIVLYYFGTGMPVCKELLERVEDQVMQETNLLQELYLQGMITQYAVL